VTPGAWDRWRLKRLLRYQRLEQRRATAQRALGLPTLDGLYRKAVAALHHARISDIKVYSTLQYSKAARTFIVPLLAVSIGLSFSDWPFTRQPLPRFLFQVQLLRIFWRDVLSAAANLQSLTAAGTAILGAVCMILYVHFRARSQRAHGSGGQ